MPRAGRAVDLTGLDLTDDADRWRALLTAHLPATAFPATRDYLVSDAVASGAPAVVLEGLRHLTPGRLFERFGDVWAELAVRLPSGSALHA